MPRIPNVDAIVDQVKRAATRIVKTDITNIRGFSERQVRMMAQQARWIAEAEASGEFDKDPKLRNWFLTNLEDLARNFAHSLRGLIAITIEKVWNAVVDVLWKVVESAAGFRLPRPV